MSNVILSAPTTMGHMQYNESVADNGAKQIKLQGVFQEAEKPNQNKRVYPRHILEREVMRLQESIKTGGAIPMAADHPPAADDNKISQMIAQRVGVSDAAGLMTNIRIQGNTVYGECVVLADDGGSGQKIASMIRNGWIPKVSSRGLGGNPSMNESGHYMIPEDYRMMCFDFVSTPSVETAILNQIHEENNQLYAQYQKEHKSNLYQVLINLRNK